MCIYEYFGRDATRSHATYEVRLETTYDALRRPEALGGMTREELHWMSQWSGQEDVVVVVVAVVVVVVVVVVLLGE